MLQMSRKSDKSKISGQNFYWSFNIDQQLFLFQFIPHLNFSKPKNKIKIKVE